MEALEALGALEALEALEGLKGLKGLEGLGLWVQGLSDVVKVFLTGFVFLCSVFRA